MLDQHLIYSSSFYSQQHNNGAMSLGEHGDARYVLSIDYAEIIRDNPYNMPPLPGSVFHQWKAILPDVVRSFLGTGWQFIDEMLELLEELPDDMQQQVQGDGEGYDHTFTCRDGNCIVLASSKRENVSYDAFIYPERGLFDLELQVSADTLKELAELVNGFVPDCGYVTSEQLSHCLNNRDDFDRCFPDEYAEHVSLHDTHFVA